MKNRRIILMLVLYFILNTINTTSTVRATNEHDAKLKSSLIELDNEQIVLSTYNVNGYNYVRIRDICKLLDYNTYWDKNITAVVIEVGNSYVHIDENDFAKEELIRTPLRKILVYINGMGDNLDSINLNGYNYVKLRDLSELSYEALESMSSEGEYFDLEWKNNTIILSKKILILATDPPKENTSTEDINAFNNEILNLVNEERVKNGIDVLIADLDLAKVAQAKSSEMADLGYFGHTSPNYGNPLNFAESHGYQVNKGIGENVAYSSVKRSAEFFMEKFMESPGHRDNILNPSYKVFGSAIAYSENKTYVTQLFAY